MRRLGLVAATAVLSLALPAAAQQKQSHAPNTETVVPAAPEGDSNMNRLIAYAATPEYFKSVSTVVLGGDHDLAPECTTTKVLGRVGFIVLKYPEFSDAQATVPANGRWKDQYAIDRCGVHVTHNVLVDAAPDAPHVGLLLPGETGLTAEMQMKGQGVAEAYGAAVKASGCQDPAQVMVTNTRHDKMLEELKPDEKGRVMSGKWRENWSFRACGKPLAVALTVSINGGAASFEAKPMEIKAEGKAKAATKK